MPARTFSPTGVEIPMREKVEKGVRDKGKSDSGSRMGNLSGNKRSCQSMGGGKHSVCLNH